MAAKPIVRKMKLSDLDGEEWRPVKGAPGYEVSSLGRVRGRTGKILRGSRAGAGYRTFAIGHRVRRYVHHVVAEAFIGPRPKGHEVNHKDGVKANCAKDNLEYTTHAENQRHGYHTLKAWVMPGRKIDRRLRAGVMAFCRDRARGVQTRAARKFKVSEATVSRIMAEVS